jgi:hypothetical protein
MPKVLAFLCYLVAFLCFLASAFAAERFAASQPGRARSRCLGARSVG